MRARQSVFAGCMLLGLMAALPAGAQHIPGINRDAAREAQSERANLLREANRTLGEWRAAWARKDARALSRSYAENALLRMPNGVQFQGRGAIEAMLRDSLPAMGTVTLGLADWEPGEPVYISGPFTFTAADRPQVTGFHAVVLVLTGGSYRIRAQVFVPDPAEES